MYSKLISQDAAHFGKPTSAYGTSILSFMMSMSKTCYPCYLSAGPLLKVSLPQPHLAGNQTFSTNTFGARSNTTSPWEFSNGISSTMLHPARSSLQPCCHHGYPQPQDHCEASEGISQMPQARPCCAGVPSGCWVVLSLATAAEASLLAPHRPPAHTCALWWDINSSWAPWARWLWALLPWALQPL